MKRILLSAAICLTCSLTFATSIQSTVDQMINKIDPNINLGMMVVDLDTGTTLYQRNATKSFTPASNMKLFSDAAALLVLGPDYHFQSQLSTDAVSLKNGTLQGSLYLTLPGDPSFKQAHLNGLFAALKKLNVNRIKGNVVIISEHGNIAPHAPGIVPKDLFYSYGAPLAPVMLDENRLTITVNPSYREGLPAIVEYDAKENSFPIDNQVKTVQKGHATGVDFKINAENHLVVKGAVSVGQGAIIQRIAIQNPLKYAEQLIKLQLNDIHIELDGRVILGSNPGKTLLLATHSSKPIKQILADTLKPSDNLYADSLFLHAAAILHGAPLNWEQAQPIVKQFLQQQTGINLQNSTLIDGSGLSRLDLVTPLQTVDLLRYLHDRFPLAFEYIAALPIAGIDGTLQKRFRKPSQQGLLRAKTGSMTGIMSLSGYLYTQNGHTLAFAIFINTRRGTSPNISGRYRTLVDTMCDYLLQQKPDNRRVYSTLNPHARVAFQQQPTEAEKKSRVQAKWRSLEFALKQALRNQAVSILFRHEQLVLIDHSSDVNKIWSILQGIAKKYSFAVALNGKSSPTGNVKTPQLLWIDAPAASKENVWTLKGTAG